ncbi:MAG: phosphomannomutase [Geminicoccus sp.]|nr:phosphomannomutase [Geminicoccus sp.]
MFKAYDVRGIVPDQLNPGVAARIAGGVMAATGGRTFVVGHDVRLHSRGLVEAMIEALVDAGGDVIDLGLCGTEEVYFWTGHEDADAGLMVTASHNPAEYNGVKFVGKAAAPLSPDGMGAVRDWAASEALLTTAAQPGRVRAPAHPEAYIDRLMGFASLEKVRPLHIVLNAGNGCAGPVVEALAERMPPQVRLSLVHGEPDGSFPHGIPNPLLPDRRQATTDVVRALGADFGVAFDGDFDRCFFFDGEGRFVEGYYIVGLLARAVLGRSAPGTPIVYDNRMTWATEAAIAAAGGRAVVSRTGHVFLKRALREHGAAYGGEMSAHHYFHEFYSCDSGMIPWLLIAQLVGEGDRSLYEHVAAAQAAFPCSGEINFRLDNTAAALTRVEAAFAGTGQREDIDGVSYSFADWRFNVRLSNTEPLLRLNVETRGDTALLAEKTDQLRTLIEAG